MRTHSRFASLLLVALIALLAACDDNDAPSAPEIPELGPGPFQFSAPVFDIAARPGGTILVAENTTVVEIHPDGTREIAAIPTVPDSPVNGLEAVNETAFFAASGGLDLAVGAGVWHVSDGSPRLVGDIEAFELANDPDALEGPQWKDPACEFNPDQGFSAGPQSNPYHLTQLSAGTVLLGDAAGNTLLSITSDGVVDWVAVFTPPVDENGDFQVLFPLDEETNCFVQPVPTSVDIGPDGAYYVGELTGVTPAELQGEVSSGLSRVWRIRADARHVVCPSDDCREVISGLTSVVDVAFGPDGRLYVVELDANGWFAATATGNPAGGTVKSCDVGSGTCSTVASGLELPGAVAFDELGDMWLLESTLVSPTVRRLTTN